MARARGLRIGLCAGLLLAAAPPAGAATYCVATSGAGCTPSAGIQAAIDSASANAGRDTIRVGAGTFSGQFAAEAGNEIEIVGAGQATVITPPAGEDDRVVLRVEHPRSTISDLAVVLGSASQVTGISTSADIARIAVTSSLGASGHTGILLRSHDADPATLAASSVQVAGTAVRTGAPAENGPVLVTDSNLAGAVGHQGAIGAATAHVATLRRTSIRAQVGSSISGGTTILDNVAIRLEGATPSGAVVGASDGLTASILARHVTVIGNGIPLSNAFGMTGFKGSPGGTAVLTVRDSVMTGVQTPLIRRGQAAGPGQTTGVATARFDYSQLDAARIDQSGPGSTSLGAGIVSGSPALPFANPGAGDFTPVAGSPLMNAGDPSTAFGAASPTDLLGRPRISGGRRDIGAFELPIAVPPPAADRSGPRIGVAPKRVRLSRRGTIKLRLTCPRSEARCTGTLAASSSKKLRLRKRAKAKRVRLFGAKRFGAFTPSRSRAVVLKVAKAARSQIARRRKLSVKVTVKGRDAAGNRATATRTITVLAPKRRRR